MASVTFIAFDGRAQTVEATAGISLMENAVSNGVEGIDAVCGGNAYCGTCRVYVDPVWQDRTGDRNELEDPMLEIVGDEHPAARLSCQILVTEALDGLIVSLPERQT